MKLIGLLRAKSRRYSENEIFLLKDHTIDTLQRAKQLKDFIDINKGTIKCQQLKNSEFFEALATAIILHDLGKINYEFQKRVYDIDSKKWKEELEKLLQTLRKVDLRHEILSSTWASILLDNSEWNAKIRTAVLLHHYNDYFTKEEKDLMRIVQNHCESIRLYLNFLIEKWNEVGEFLNDLLNEIEKKFNNDDFIKSVVNKIQKINCLEKAKSLLEKIENHENDISEFAEFYDIDNENLDYEFMVFLGCLRRCDYSASGDVDLEKTNCMDDVYAKLKERIRNKVKSESLWQEDVLEKIDPLKSIVLVAPTGSGKTEFALLWAGKNKRKLIYTLPFRVALNDLFSRFKGEDNAYFEKEFVDILHSTAFIEYIEYLEREKAREQEDIEKQLNAAKLLSSPVLLTTPDQVFLTSLNYYGSDKVLAIYPLSSIVIDEIQTYDEEMASIIVKTLQIVKKLGGIVLVMTATLPPYFERFLKDLGFEFKELEDIKERVKNYSIRRHKIKVVDKALFKYKHKDNNKKVEIEESEEFKLWLNKFKDKNTFIVVNNVSKAIEIYKWLKNKGYPNVFLLHSRLIEKEKSRRIKLIKKLIKRDEEEIEKLIQNSEKVDLEKPVIAVATQVIEASVDLDFDAMITEISTVDSQIQRWGRVYRNKDRDYDEEEPNIVIFAGKQENGEFDRGTKMIYDEKVIEKTVEVLKEFEGKVLNYEDEKRMVDKVFNRKIGDETLKELYIKKIEENLEFLKYFTAEKRSEAQRIFRRIAGIQVVIPEIMKHYGDDLAKKFAGIVENADSDKKTWDEIVSELGSDPRKAENKWLLKKILYEYSVNIPVFYWKGEKLLSLRTHEFKGFQVLKLSKEQAKEVWEYGIDSDKIFRRMEEEVYSAEII